ncbi:cell division protein SepF [Pseudolysinimonas yzui]|uniref:Cell division protein SepF n=2 Tax=Pseudolysinimonas yzui TaxID=2708254 RepID=A0A8J3GPE4_9MICO|nr:cell division protein SepF [Pseudolysinimonas yzui]
MTAAPILREDDMANPLRKTMVYLGLADEDYDEHLPAAPVAPVASTAGRAPVTPLRRPAAASTKHAAPGMNEILTVNPRQYKDVQAIAEAFREGVPVIMNLSQMPEPDARRLIDFASGLASGLYGKIERVTNKVFLLSPEHVAVSGEAEEAEAGVDAGFFAQ